MRSMLNFHLFGKYDPKQIKQRQSLTLYFPNPDVVLNTRHIQNAFTLKVICGSKYDSIAKKVLQRFRLLFRIN